MDIRDLLIQLAQIFQTQKSMPMANPIYEDTQTVGGVGGGGFNTMSNGNQSIGADQYGQWGSSPPPTTDGLYEDTKTVNGVGGVPDDTWADMDLQDAFGTWGVAPTRPPSVPSAGIRPAGDTAALSPLLLALALANQRRQQAQQPIYGPAVPASTAGLFGNSQAPAPSPLMNRLTGTRRLF